jgi:hypothetical protein
MAIFNFLSKQERVQIGKQLASWMPEMSTWQSCQVAESIELYTVDLSSLQGHARAKACLRKMNCWHIQVLVNEKPMYFARVADDGKDGWEVYSFYGPGKADAIDSALTWIDEYIHDKYVVNMFEIPAYYITGFTLEKGEDVRVYIVDTPPDMSIKAGKIYRFDEMRGMLKTQNPIHGVTS